MLLVSLGWRIIRHDLNPRERQFFSGGFSLYAILDFMRRICTEGLCTAYLLSFYVVKFLILFCILVAINSNIGTLIFTNHVTLTIFLLEKLRSSSFDAQAASSSALYGCYCMLVSFGLHDGLAVILSYRYFKIFGGYSLLLSYCLEQSTSSSVSCVYFLSNYTNQVQ
jgi:phosphotransferase system  glucose/maltose/N-acetylglucosamine-specific IIC component